MMWEGGCAINVDIVLIALCVRVKHCALLHAGSVMSDSRQKSPSVPGVCGLEKRQENKQLQIYVNYSAL